MNSDPHESAAWRIFGLLDADEAAGFDDAMRDDPELKNAYREIECLTAAVAAATTPAVSPRPGQLARLQLKLGLHPSKNTNWLGISGWAAAAALTLILVFQREPKVQNTSARNEAPLTIPSQPQPAIVAPQHAQIVPSSEYAEIQPHSKDVPPSEIATATPQPESKVIVKVETQRLIQEIEILREKLDHFEQQDRQRFEPVPGLAWPVVMRMTPPRAHTAESGSLTLEKENSDITSMLGDALAAVASGEALPDPQVKTGEPSAIQIYDPANDAGTFIVNDLPTATEEEEYSLFVSEKAGGTPILVGRLPRTDVGRSKSFDYALGKTSTVPAMFTLVRNKRGKSEQPTEQNTVLRGPK